jgi:hypothetical protein
VAAAAVAAQTRPEPPALDVLLARSAATVQRFEQAFSNLVARERYEQDLLPVGPTYVGGPRARHRELVSDFLLVRPGDGGDWLPFRDVFEVDGQAVRDHDDRLARLFLDWTGTSAQRAAEITEQSARYNIGTVRTVNHPLLALHILRGGQQHRFAFSDLKTDPSAGPDVLVLDFRERTRPSIIRGPAGRDLLMHGRLWLTGATGSLAKAEILVDGPGMTASLTTRFALDPESGAAIPVEMREDYREPDGTRVTGLARYEDVRRFQVEVEYGGR